MREVQVLGVGMTAFGKFLERGLKDLGGEATREALGDAGVAGDDLEAAFVGNAMAGLITGQECIRGQVILRALGLGGLPVYNLENACASASTAFHTAWMAVAGGMYDVVLALGVEKLYDADRRKSFAALGSAVDMEAAAAFAHELNRDRGADASAGAGETRSVFMDYYASEAREHMARYGTRPEDYARVAVKNHTNGSLNPKAQFQRARTLEEVMAAPMIADPLTRLMCSPIGDGAAAAVLVSAEFARRRAHARPVTVAASVLSSGSSAARREAAVVSRASERAYRMAGIGPEDIDVAEVHDASAPAEIFIYEELGLCKPGEGGRLVSDGVTTLTGKVPVNTSGGLLAKGHPVGATGIAQVVEVIEQLRGRAGARQVTGARVGLTQNAGGVLDGEPAACAVHVFKV
jgi:acetyl-CoA acetyltransferase